jgi:hypothetical protein
MKEDAIRKFPKALYMRIGWKELREPSCHAKAAASILAGNFVEEGGRERK